MDNVIKEIAVTFRSFIYRDLIYIIGGSIIIVAFFYASDNLSDLAALSSSGIALFVGVAYVIGYGIQDAMSIAKFVSTAFYSPGRIIQFLGSRFSPGEKWESIPLGESIDIRKFHSCVDSHMPDGEITRRNRIIDLKQLCATMGSSGLVCAFLLLLRIYRYHAHMDISIMLFIGTILMTIIFVILNRLNNAQQRLIELATYNTCDRCGYYKN